MKLGPRRDIRRAQLFVCHCNGMSEGRQRPGLPAWRVKEVVGRRVPEMASLWAMSGLCVLDCCARR
eukprot:371236-Pyramimonas_sp.AAC.1